VNTFRNVKETLPLVNVPMLYPNIEEIMKIIVEEGENRFTSAGTKNVDPYLKKKMVLTVHVVSSTLFALSAKCGVDAIVAEGFEAEVIMVG
jgi:enoyl-[acyl-carrier protein] reductase II